MVLSASPPLFPKAVTDCLAQIASELCQDAQLLRIKKLLFYVCTENWETDAQHLERLSLEVLLLHLLECSPSFEAFQQKVNQAAATLNKSAEYLIVANTVIGRFAAVYAELHQEELATTSPESYSWVVQQLQTLAPSSTAQRRIKKLMLLTCRGTWETAASQLEALSLSELVPELHQLAPTAKSLSTTLNQAAQALSKPEDYAQVASTISLAFQTLYSGGVTDPVTELRPASAPAAAALTSLPHLTAEQPTRTMLRVVPTVRPASSSPPALKVLAQRQQSIDLFDLRLKIMQDGNPYRIKILLFSLLHEPFQSDDHEAQLRTHELDDLLRILFLSYRHYAELDGKLRQVAVALGKDEYMQAAEALLRALLPYYVVPESAELMAEPSAEPIGEPIAEPHLQSALTEITYMKADREADSPEITLPESALAEY
jgi:hypothetical protein